MCVSCQYTTKLVFHDYGMTEHTLLVCHEGLFTNSAIHASGIIRHDLLLWDHIMNLILTPQSAHDSANGATETTVPKAEITPIYITETPKPNQ